MGSVHLAERAEGEFRQRVAVEVVPGGFEDEEAVERFRAERQVLTRDCDVRCLDGEERGRPRSFSR